MTNIQSVGSMTLRNLPVPVEKDIKNNHRISFKNDGNDRFVRGKQSTLPQNMMNPQQAHMMRMMDEQRKEQKKQKLKQNLSWGIGIVSGIAIIAMVAMQMKAMRGGKGAGGVTDVSEKKLNQLREMLGDDGKDLIDLIRECQDPKLRRLMFDELNKGFGASEKKIRALGTLANLGKSELKKVNIEEAKKILDQKVIGMEEAKDQVLNYLKYRNTCIDKGINPGPFVLALDGPPGTAKTTLAKAIAEICGMPSKEISMAGMTGKAPLKGSEAVYQGAEWGAFADAQIEHKRKDICFILDEIEKFGLSEHNGKPDDVLLSALDKRHSVFDDFLGCDIDLNNSIIITTSNDFGKLNEILRSRLGTPVTISPYENGIKEKIIKFKADLCMKDHKIDDVVKLSDDAVTEILTRNEESQGGREVTEEIEKVIKMVFSEEAVSASKEKPFTITRDTVNKYLPKKLF